MYLNVCTGYDVPERLVNLREKNSHRGTAITGQLNYCDFAIFEILLIAQVLIARQKDIEAFFGESEKFSVLNARPSAILCRFD
jgi:hypothetical protein